MLTREDAVRACLTLPLAYEDLPFGEEWSCMRHRGNQKIFAMIYAHEGRIWMNVKAEPQWADFWKNTFPTVVPAYHMNKKHWVSIILDGSMTDEQIMQLVEDSFMLTAPKAKKAKRKAP